MDKKCQCNLAQVYCENKIDFTKEPLFLGKGKNLQRYDVFAREVFDNINDKMISLFWRPQEIDLTKDSLDVENAVEHELFILTTVLQKLTFLDSTMGRTPAATLGQIASIPELEGALLTWTWFESLHSRSYSWILQNCYPNPSTVFDEIHDIKVIKNIATFISRNYNELYKQVILFQAAVLNNEQGFNKTPMMRALLRFVMTVNCLEGIEFLSGFSGVWSLTHSKGIFPGVTKILQFIARDELQHLRLTQNINNILKTDEEEGFSELWHSMTTEFYNIYLEAVKLEEAFIDYIYSKGTIIGMNPDIAKDYLHYVTNQRMITVGLKPLFTDIKKNPISWIDKYYDLKGTVGALQELENSDYKLGSIFFNALATKIQRKFNFGEQK